MNGICPTCGLPKELCACETIAKEEQTITIKRVKRKFGKIMTLIEGINEKEVNTKEILKKLKSRLACGGTSKKGVIELQGNHGNKVKEELIKLGFAPDTIQIK